MASSLLVRTVCVGDVRVGVSHRSRATVATTRAPRLSARCPSLRAAPLRRSAPARSFQVRAEHAYTAQRRSAWHRTASGVT